MNFKSIITLLTFSILTSCKSGKKDDGKTYNKTFETGDIPGISDFEKLSPSELQLDSIYSARDTMFPHATDLYKREFLDNRSRIYMDSDPNHKLYAGDKDLDKGFPASCNCAIANDSLFVKTGVGFFGGSGFEIMLHKDSFLSDFFIYTDDVKPYKSSLQDTAFADNAIAFSKFQYLILDKQPTYKSGQQLTGYLTYTSNRFYETQDQKTLDSTYVTGKIYFTCKTKQLKEKYWAK